MGFWGLARNSQAATYYIDYVNGSDSNNGTSISAPWKRAPGMAGPLVTVFGSWTQVSPNVWTTNAGIANPDECYFNGVIGTKVLYGGSPDEVNGDKKWAGWFGTTMKVYSIGNPDTTYAPLGIQVRINSNYLPPGYSHSAGDKFVFKGGVTWDKWALPLRIQNSGIDGNPDIYVGGQKESTPWGTGFPVFDGEDADTGGISVSSKNYITLNGLRVLNTGNPIYGSGSGISVSGSTGFTMKYCSLEPNAVNGFVYSGTGSKVYLHDNFIAKLGRINFPIEHDTLDDLRIYNNLFAGNNGYNPDPITATCTSAGVPAACCTGLGTGDGTCGFHTDGIMLGSDGPTNYGLTNVQVYNNKWYGDWRNGGTGLLYFNGKGDGTTPSTQHVKIYNNLFAVENNTSATGGVLFSPGMVVFYGGAYDDIEIYNNTFDNSAFHSSTTAPTCITLTTSTNVFVKNNIFSYCDNSIITSKTQGGSGLIADYNLYFPETNNHFIWDANARYDSLVDLRAAGYESHGIVNSDPKFVALPSGGATGSGNWQLQSSSPAINAGADLSGIFNNDILGTSRPQGSVWDIGAYEYVPGGDTPPPAAPAGLVVR